MAQTSYRFGRYDVALLQDGVFVASPELPIHARSEEARRRAMEAFGDNGIKIDINCFLLRGPDGICLIDAGAGDVWGPDFGHARAALQQEGIAPEAIDRVLLTHIHGDHALGLLEGAAPWLPHAEILVPEVDLAFFTDASARQGLPEARHGGFEVATKLVAAYGSRLRAIPSGAVPELPGVEAVALPGHTPGHSGYRLAGDADSLLLWADALHLRELQTADPELGLGFDIDPAQAVATRQSLLEDAAREGWMVAGSHVTGFGRIRRDGTGYRFDPV